MEEEMLAIVFSLEKFHKYTFGRPVIVRSDHKPLESILKKLLSSTLRCLQGVMMRLQNFNIDVRCECSAKMYIADLPLKSLPSGSWRWRRGRIRTSEHDRTSACQWQETKKNPERTDQTLQVLKSLILKGWPNDKSDLPLRANPYYGLRDEMSPKWCNYYRANSSNPY